MHRAFLDAVLLIKSVCRVMTQEETHTHTHTHTSLFQHTTALVRETQEGDNRKGKERMQERERQGRKKPADSDSEAPYSPLSQWNAER